MYSATSFGGDVDPLPDKQSCQQVRQIRTANVGRLAFASGNLNESHGWGCRVPNPVRAAVHDLYRWL